MASVETTSGRRRGLPARIARLLEDLSAPAADETVIDRIAADFAPVSAGGRVIRAAVAFTGTLPAAVLPQAVRSLTRSRRADLAGIAWALLSLNCGGRSVLLVPEGFLSEATRGHLDLRRAMVEGGGLHGVIRLAPGVYRPRAGAAVLLLGPSDPGPVWCRDVLSAREVDVVADERGQSGCPLVIGWRDRAGDTQALVPRTALAAAAFDLRPSRHRPVPDEPAAPSRRPHEILAELAGLEAEILQGLRELASMMKA